MRLSGGRLLDLPAKIVSAFVRDKEPDQSTSLFYYLFVPASGEAFGTEHYFAGYRIMRPDEIDLAIGHWTSVRSAAFIKPPCRLTFA